MKNLVAFQKFGILAPDHGYSDPKYAFQFQAELMNVGYALSLEAFEALVKSDPGHIKQLAQVIIDYIRKSMGDGEYKPLFGGFPISVKGMAPSVRFMLQLNAYWGLLPEYQEFVGEFEFEYTEFKELKLMTEKDFMGIFTKLTSVNQSITQSDLIILNWFLEEYSKEELNPYLTKVPFKETLCMLAKYGLDVPVKTPTDVMRIAAYLSHGSTDLNLPPKYIKKYRWSALELNQERINRRWDLDFEEKVYIMSLLEKVPFVKQMIGRKRRNMWVTLAHHIQSQRYSKVYPKAYQALQTCRNLQSIRQSNSGLPYTFMGEVNRAWNKGSLSKAVGLLATRPGEFLRRFNEIWGKVEANRQKALVLETFNEVAPKVSSKVLFEFWTYLEGRIKDQEEGDRKVWTGEKRRPTKLEPLEGLGESLVNDLQSRIWDALSIRASKLSSLGDCYIDPELKKIPLPTNMRTIEPSMVPMIRGQRYPFTAEKRYLRLYCHWQSGVDIDFTCSVVNKSGNTYKVGYGGHDRVDGILFSGDNRGNYQKNAEYIDIDLNNTEAKYILMMANIYSSHYDGNFSDLKTRVGWMERDYSEKNDRWYPKTVKNSFSPQSKARAVNFMVFDIPNREYILIDEDARNVQVSSKNDILQYVKQISEPIKYSVYDLMYLHLQARGGRLVKKEDRNTDTTNFMFKDFSKDYLEIMKYMSI